jgi:DNA repair exonuclease SbcCD ATPase subunit
MDTHNVMEKKRINPIVAQREDQIGRSASDTSNSSARKEKTGGGGNSGSGGGATAGGMSGGWKFLVVFACLGVLGAGGFGWMEYTSLSGKHQALQTRFEALESRLSNTDESVTQSGAALQIKLGRQGDELKKHWKEIKKLWGVTNDINKGKIEKNQKDISFLASKRQALETAVAKDSKSLKALSGNYLGISADLDAANENMRNYADGLNRLNNSLSRIDRELKSNAEAVESMEAFRRQINQKIYALEQSAPAPATLTN